VDVTARKIISALPDISRGIFYNGFNSLTTTIISVTCFVVPEFRNGE
jgi:hypothetical protein